MYVTPDLGAANAAWWAGLARHLRAAGLDDVPERLTQPATPPELWRDPGLLFAQTCGYPFTHAFAGRLRLIATPCYDAPGCTGPYYASAIVVRSDAPAARLPDLLGLCAAVNETNSQSGHHALHQAMSPLSGGGAPFQAVIPTSSHAASLAAVQSGEADVCAIDAVAHALLVRHAPERLDGLRVLTFTDPTPGLPYVTAAAQSGGTVARLREGLFRALNDPDLAQVRADLLIAGAEILDAGAYDVLRERAQVAAAQCPPLLSASSS